MFVSHPVTGNLILTAEVSSFPSLFIHFPFDTLLITEEKVIEVNKELVRQTRTWQTWKVEECLAGGWLETDSINSFNLNITLVTYSVISGCLFHLKSYSVLFSVLNHLSY